jgi:TolB protein
MLKSLLSIWTVTASALLFGAGAESDQEIRVHLTTDSPLTPVYLGRLKAEQSSFDANFLNQLDTILQFDFNYNGTTQVVTRSTEKEQVLQQKEKSVAFHPKTWKDFGIPYVIQPVISDKTLSVLVFSVESGSLKYFNDIPLTGELVYDRRQLHKLADGIYKALFNSDGIASTRLLYSVQFKNPKPDGSQWISEIWECDWDGNNARQVTKEGSYSVTPVAIPSKSDRFLYVSYKLGQPKIYLASLKEGVGKRLIDLRGNQLLPAISLQRDKIAFICDAGGRTDLFVQAFHPEKGEIGKPVQLFSYPRSTQASPTFNPDGSKVAFVSDKDGSPRIYVIPSTVSAKRANPSLITKQNSESSCPSWSPDGKKLAYSAKTNGVRQIWIYDFETREETQLTSGPGHKENPCWAPDSLHIVFNSTDASSSELYLVNLHQPETIKITRGPGKKHYPTWGKRGDL